MRFLLGLMIGAAVVVAVAEGMQAPDGWRSSLEAAAGAAAERAQDWLRRAEVAVERTPSEPTHRAPSEEASTEREMLASAENAPADAEAALEPIPRPPDTRRIEESESLVVDPTPPADTAGALAAPEGPDLASAALEERDFPSLALKDPGSLSLTLKKTDSVSPSPEEPAVPPPVPEEAAEASGFRLQAVWVPFHSRVSANGFAERLMESLDHPFAVERQGPRRYQVVFPYADEPERQALLAQAAEASGLPL